MTAAGPPPFAPPRDRPELLPASGVLTVTSITLDGVALDLHGVLADVTIRHGRAGYFDSASPSTCQIELLGVTRAFTRPFRLGSVLVVNATDGVSTAARFTGRLTDGDLVGDELTAIAVGRLRTLSGYTVGAVDYPEERWSARVARVFAEAGLAPSSTPLANPSFEENVNYWGSQGGTLTSVATPVKDGAGAAKIAVVNGGAGALIYQGFNYPSPGSSYTAKLSVYIPGSWSAAGPLFLYAAGGIASAYANVDTSKRDQWQEIRLGPFVAPAGTDYFVLGSTAAARPGDVFYVDAAMIALASSDVLELEVGAFDPILLARPADPLALDAYLGELVETVESAVADRPDGRILVQALSARSSSGAIALDPAEVAYAPAWEMRLPAANVVEVAYGNPEASITVTDAGSTAIYGPIKTELKTTIKQRYEAANAANNRLGRSAYAVWTVPAASLLFGRRLPIGKPVGLSLLPPAAPFPSWAPVLEGWTDRIVSDGDELVWTMELALSDPLLSGLTLPWVSVPVDAAHHWNTINQAVAWRDALTLADLNP